MYTIALSHVTITTISDAVQYIAKIDGRISDAFIVSKKKDQLAHIHGNSNEHYRYKKGEL